MLKGILKGDLWRNVKGLGFTGADIMQALIENGELDIASIVRIASVSERTVWRKIKQMRDLCLVATRVVKNRTLVKAVKKPDYERAAKALGVHGALKRQIERHERERRAYRANLKRRH